MFEKDGECRAGGRRAGICDLPRLTGESGVVKRWDTCGRELASVMTRFLGSVLALVRNDLDSLGAPSTTLRVVPLPRKDAGED